MAHPDALSWSCPLQEPRLPLLLEISGAVLATVALLHGASERIRHELLPVADAENGKAGVKESGIDRRAARLVNARRSA
jgi:hypothetical protein